MTRDEDDKRGNDELDEFGRKIEARFTKQARATQKQDGKIDSRKIDKSHHHDGGEHKH